MENTVGNGGDAGGRWLFGADNLQDPKRTTGQDSARYRLSILFGIVCY